MDEPVSGCMLTRRVSNTESTEDTRRRKAERKGGQREEGGDPDGDGRTGSGTSGIIKMEVQGWGRIHARPGRSSCFTMSVLRRV